MNILCLFKHKWECIEDYRNSTFYMRKYTFKMKCSKCGKIETWIDLAEGKKRSGIYQKIN